MSKRIKKKIVAVILSISCLMYANMSAFAADNEMNFEIGAVMVDQETGEKTPVDVEYKITPISKFANTDEQTCIAEVTANFKLPTPEIAPLLSDTSTSESDVKASISIHYDRRNDEIRVNKVSGFWEPSNSQIFLNNREVIYGDGVPVVGKHDKKNPTTNTFEYPTGWGWVLYYPAAPDALSGARAFSSAVVNVSGMSPHTIEVFVTANQ